MRWIRCFVATSVCVGTLAGCALLPPTVHELWAVAADPIGQPVVEDGVVVGYVDTHDGLLALEGRDVETGELLWSVEARPGFVPQGIRIVPSIADGYAAVLVPIPGDRYYGVQLVDVSSGGIRFAVDPETGEPRPLAPDRRPEVCTDDERLLCMDGRLVEPSRRTEFVIDPVVGTVVPAPDAFVDEGFWLSDELRMTDDGRLVRIDDGEELWSTRYEEVFGDGYTTEGGWSWDFDEDAGVFVGTARGVDPDDDERLAPELDDVVSAAVDADTGELVWREPHTSAFCRAAEAASDLRCRVVDGRWVDDADEPDGYRLTDVDLVLERFDPATGETRWQLPLDDDVTVYRHGLPFAPSESELFLRSGGPVVAVDRSTGAARPMPAGATYLCTSDPDIRLRRSGVEDAEPVVYYGTPLLRPCDENGQDAVSLPPAEVVVELDEDDDGTVVIAEPGGYRAYRLVGAR